MFLLEVAICAAGMGDFPISHVVEYPMQCNDMSDRLKYKK